MTLSFQTHVDGRPTYFIEKIWQGLNLGLDGYQIEFSDRRKWIAECIRKGVYDHSNITPNAPKIHTIREDKSDRWEAGTKIHFVINNRTPDRFQFAPVIKCTGVQEIFMTVQYGKLEITIDNDNYLYQDEQEKLALNDGFDYLQHFEEYFIPKIINSEYRCFSGKIIHWTDQRYV